MISSEAKLFRPTEPVKNITPPDFDKKLIMDRDGLDRLVKQAGRSPENRQLLDELEKRITEISGGQRIHIFDSLKKKERGEKDEYEISYEDISKAIENIPLETKLRDLPKDLLGKIYHPLSNEIRQLLYVQRENFSLEQALRIIRHWTSDKVITAFHVSSREMKVGDKLIPGDNEGAVFYSNDIKHLFNNVNEAKYIYAFRLSRDTDNRARYAGAPEHFRKLGVQDSGVEIEDAIKLIDEKDLGYRKKVMSELGAFFEESYRGAGSSVERFIESRRDGADNELRA